MILWGSWLGVTVITLFCLVCAYIILSSIKSTHNLCFRAKIRKNVYPCKPQFYYMKVGVRGSTLHGLVIIMFSSREILSNPNLGKFN